jgi:hypothetical protein
MRGSLTVPFSALFIDTVCTHGAAWAFKHYTRKGMSREEFGFWLSIVPFKGSK